MQWCRVRAAPASTPPPHDLHVSACLDDLRPGDHFEIQWRKNKDFPYGMHPIQSVVIISKQNSSLVLPRCSI